MALPRAQTSAINKENFEKVLGQFFSAILGPVSTGGGASHQPTQSSTAPISQATASAATGSGISHSVVSSGSPSSKAIPSSTTATNSATTSFSSASSLASTTSTSPLSTVSSTQSLATSTTSTRAVSSSASQTHSTASTGSSSSITSQTISSSTTSPVSSSTTSGTLSSTSQASVSTTSQASTSTSHTPSSWTSTSSSPSSSAHPGGSFNANAEGTSGITGASTSSQPSVPVIIGAVAASLFALLAVVFLIVFLLKRRRKKAEKHTFGGPREISGPIPDMPNPHEGNMPVLSYYQGWNDDSLSQEKWGERPVNGEQDWEKGSVESHSNDYHPEFPQQHPDRTSTPPQLDWTPNGSFGPDETQRDIPSQHRNEPRRAAESLYTESVLDYYNTQRLSRRDTTQTYTSPYDGYYDDAPPVPPVPAIHVNGRLSEIYAEDEYKDVHITPPHSPILEPANTAPLSIKRNQDLSLKERIRARTNGGNSIDLNASPRSSFEDLEANRPAGDTATGTQQAGYSEWVPAFLRR